jgi:hypothetical protein
VNAAAREFFSHSLNCRQEVLNPWAADILEENLSDEPRLPGWDSPAPLGFQTPPGQKTIRRT